MIYIIRDVALDSLYHWGYFKTKLQADEWLAHEMNTSSIKWNDKFWKAVLVQAMKEAK